MPLSTSSTQGSPQAPSRPKGARRLTKVLLWIPFVGAMVGVGWSRFIPSQAVVYLGVAGGIAYAVAMVFVSAAKNEKFKNVSGRSLQYRLLRNPWARGLLVAGVGFGFGFAGFAWGFPWLLNMAIGSEGAKTVVITGWSSGDRYNCSTAQIAGTNSPDALCVTENAYRSVPVGSRLRLVGPTSFLGTDVEKIYLLRRPAGNNGHLH